MGDDRKVLKIFYDYHFRFKSDLSMFDCSRFISDLEVKSMKFSPSNNIDKKGAYHYWIYKFHFL